MYGIHIASADAHFSPFPFLVFEAVVQLGFLPSLPKNKFRIIHKLNFVDFTSSLRFLRSLRKQSLRIAYLFIRRSLLSAHCFSVTLIVALCYFHAHLFISTLYPSLYPAIFWLSMVWCGCRSDQRSYSKKLIFVRN